MALKERTRPSVYICICSRIILGFNDREGLGRQAKVRTVDRDMMQTPYYVI